MTIRTTPTRYRQVDAEMFPRLAARRAATRFPLMFWVKAGPSRVRISADGFFVPPELAERIEETYEQYIDWWFTKGNPARKRAPRSIGWGSPFQDFVSVYVLREHAEWWIRLLDGCAPFTHGFSYLEDEAPAREAWQRELRPE
jgi:hypothetical protein